MIRDGWIPASIYPDDLNVISYGVRWHLHR
jgi:hypothetical protein